MQTFSEFGNILTLSLFISEVVFFKKYKIISTIIFGPLLIGAFMTYKISRSSGSFVRFPLKLSEGKSNIIKYGFLKVLLEIKQ